MDGECTDQIEKVIEVARQLKELSREGLESDPDDGCAALYGIMRDCAYRIRDRAVEERLRHRTRSLRTA